MKDGVRMALAVAAGYYLGRHHRLRTAAALGAAALLGRMRGDSGLLDRGMKLLGTSPELEKITDQLRGELVEAGKAAAVTATSRQIDSLSSRLHDRAEAMRGSAVPKGSAEPEPAEPEKPTADRSPEGEEDYADAEPEERPQPRRPRPVRRPSPARR